MGELDRKLAVAVASGADLDDIEVSRYDDTVFVVDGRTVKQGEPPSHYVTWAKDLHELLAKFNVDEKAWQDLLVTDTTDASYHRIEKAVVPAALTGYGWPQKEGEIHWYANGFYHLICGDSKDWHVRALRDAFNGEEIVDNRPDMQIDSGEYMVLTDYEADARARESIRNLLDETVYAELTGIARDYFDEGRYIEDVMHHDGRGSVLASYDSDETEVTFYERKDLLDKLYWDEDGNTNEDWVWPAAEWEDDHEDDTLYVYRVN